MHQKFSQIWVSELAAYVNARLVGDDFLLEGGLGQIRSEGEFGNVDRLPMPSGKWVLIAKEGGAVHKAPAAVLFIQGNPDQSYVDMVNEFFATGREPVIHPTAQVSPRAKLGRNISIGAYSVIGDEVDIGHGSEIQNHVCLYGPTSVGARVVIMDGAIIGNNSHQFVEDSGGRLIQPPAFGLVRLGDGVRIGCHSSIERGVGLPTEVGPETKVDSLVNIGAGARVGRRVVIAAGSILGRGVQLGDECQVGMSCTLKPGVTLGPGVVLGQSAAVVCDLTEAGIYAGVPAKRINK